jgi:hypothetical protein
MIIAPILLEVRRQINYQIGLFSGSEFNVAPEKGLKNPDNLWSRHIGNQLEIFEIGGRDCLY